MLTMCVKNVGGSTKAIYPICMSYSNTRGSMKYTCKVCGWVKENEPSHHVTDTDYKDIFKHEKTHKKELSMTPKEDDM